MFQIVLKITCLEPAVVWCCNAFQNKIKLRISLLLPLQTCSGVGGKQAGLGFREALRGLMSLTSYAVGVYKCHVRPLLGCKQTRVLAARRIISCNQGATRPVLQVRAQNIG